MGGYFKPWRRKIGVVTLVMACVLMVGWVRSLSGLDSFLWPSGTGRVFGLMSTDQYFGCGVRDSVWKQEPLGFPRWHTGEFRSVNQWIDEIPDKSWQFRQVNFAVIHSKGENTTICFTPYWSIVIPLTLLSAYLLLPKPRKSNQKKIVEPLIEKVA